jgi:hypothetical protein
VDFHGIFYCIARNRIQATRDSTPKTPPRQAPDADAAVQAGPGRDKRRRTQTAKIRQKQQLLRGIDIPMENFFLIIWRIIFYA